MTRRVPVNERCLVQQVELEGQELFGITPKT